MRLTNTQNKHISGVWLHGDEIDRHNSEIVSIKPDLVGSQTSTADEAELVLLAWLKLDFVTLARWADAIGILGGITVIHTLAVQESSRGDMCVICDLLVEITEGVCMVPICDKQWLHINVIVCAGGAVDHHWTASAVGI